MVQKGSIKKFTCSRLNKKFNCDNKENKEFHLLAASSHCFSLCHISSVFFSLPSPFCPWSKEKNILEIFQELNLLWNYEGIMFTATCHSPIHVINFETFKVSHGCFQITSITHLFSCLYYNDTFAAAVIYNIIGKVITKM